MKSCVPSLAIPHVALPAVEWRHSEAYIHYPEAVAFMEQRVADIQSGAAPECVWLVEHPPLYTAGVSATPADLLDAERFPVYPTGRGGQYTYHGPGMRIAYTMLDLKQRVAPGQGPDIRSYIQQLEEWIIRTLAVFGVKGERRCGRIGVWVVMPNGGEKKIAAIGVRVRRWVSYHGIAINVNPDLSHFSGIVPCGLASYGVTSLQQLGVSASMAEVDAVLRQQFNAIFISAQ